MNGPDHSRKIRPPEPDVNVGPNTAFGGKGRKRPCKVQVAPPFHSMTYQD